MAELDTARLTERLTKTLAEFEITLQPADLIREISIYANAATFPKRSCAAKPIWSSCHYLGIVRKFGPQTGILDPGDVSKTNTIGSKANDVQISRHVIEIKALIERVREMIQNVE